MTTTIINSPPITVEASVYHELHRRLEAAEMRCLELSKENEQLRLKARLTELGDKELAYTEELTRLADELAYTKNALRDEQFEHDNTRRLQKATRDEVNRKQAELDELRDPSKLDARVQRVYAQLGAQQEELHQAQAKLRAQAIHMEALSRVRLTDADVKRLEEREKKLRLREERMAKQLEKDLIREEAIEARVQAELAEIEDPYARRRRLIGSGE